MPWLIELLIPLVTALVGYIAKNQDKFLDAIFAKIGSMMNHKIGEHTAAVIVSTEPNVFVEMDNGDGEILKRKADDKGCAEFKENLKKGDIVKLSAYGDDFCPGFTEITIDNTQVAYCVVLKLKKRKKVKKGA